MKGEDEERDAYITILHYNDKALVAVSKTVVVLHHIGVAQIGQHLNFIPHLCNHIQQHVRFDLCS